MCRSPADLRSGAAGLWLALLLLGQPSFAQPADEAVPLRPEVQKRLAALQGDWLDWLTAVQSGDDARASLAADELLEGVGETGLERLPALSTAAAARAVAFAAEGREENAAQSLDVAERLDPGRPETAFARATVAREKGDLLSAAGSYLSGIARLFWIPLTRYVLLSNLLMWLLLTLALATLVFIGVQMTTRGQLLYRDLSQALSRSLPPLPAHLLTLAILLWPALLPAGLLWVAFFWSVLLWGYGTRAERMVMVGVWVFIGALPFLVSEQARRMDLSLSRPVRAIQSVASGRLEGQLLNDLQVLHDLLPESVPVKHLRADLHLQLRQFDYSRVLYRQVLDAEPTATAAITDLGVGLFYEGDLPGAVAALEDAVSRPDASAEAYFSLGRAYAEDLRFDKQAPMTQRASQIADSEVRRWLQLDVSEEVISVAAGFDRGTEIRRELAKVWRAGQGDPSLIAPWKRMLSLPLALVFILPAIALNFLKRRSRNRSRRIEVDWWDGELDTARRAFLPAIPEAEQGRSLRGLAGLVVLLGLVTLGTRSLMSYTLPLGYDPRMSFLSWIPIVGVVVYFSLRYRRALLGTPRTPSKD